LCKSDTEGKEKDYRTPVDLFIFAHYYLKRPQLPAPRYPNCHTKEFLKKISISFVAGTRLSKSLFDDLFFGVSVGHFLSSVGLVIGVNYRTTIIEKDDGKETKRMPPCFSFGIIFVL
jgi:hypothetical protein